MLVFWCLVAVFLGVSVASDAVAPSFSWPEGDPRRCIVHATQSNMKLGRFEVLPGIGWDNLRNVEAGQVIFFNYSHCRATDDGVFLIPDSVFTVPVKSSEGQTFAELIDHWTNDTSTTSNTINAHAGLSLGHFGISGKYSHEHTVLKTKQIEDKSVTVRTQIRYKRYESKLQPDAVITPEFKARILKIAGHVMLNETEQAYYEGQLLVRDFGTHVLTSVTAGAALIKEDYLKENFMQSKSTDITKVLASAGVSFGSIFSAGAGSSSETDKTTSEMYNKSMTHSFVRTHGGGLFVPGTTTASKWSESVDTNLVPLDRAGDPLYFLITPQAFPQLPTLLVSDVESIVRHSVELYYKMNLIPGCTKLGSPNFSMSANIDDGSCKDRPTNKTFGGVYQTCTISGSVLTKNPCQGLDQVNPKTGKHNCPPNYTPILLHSGGTSTTHESRRSCHRCGLFFHCCHTDDFTARGIYDTYWCAATGHIPQDSGYLFGGIYTSTLRNEVTGTKACPANFYPRLMFKDAYVCISDDFELGAPFAVPFGGFFSCSSGNPLATGDIIPVGLKANREGPSLKQFLANENGKHSDWPSTCPKGYSQHMALDDQGCAIHYCVQTGALNPGGLPPVKRPPFSPKPAPILDNPDNMVMFNMKTSKWVRDEDAKLLQSRLEHSTPTENSDGSDGSDGISPGLAAGIGIMGTVVAFVAIAIVVASGRRIRRRIRGSEEYVRLQG